MGYLYKGAVGRGTLSWRAASCWFLKPRQLLRYPNQKYRFSIDFASLFVLFLL